MLTSLILMALQSQSGAISPCRKLMRDFAINEQNYTISHKIDGELLRSAQALSDVTRDRSHFREQLVQNGRRNQESLATGDRLVALMAGHGCPLPDHVTSPETFRADLAACEAAKDTANEQERCAYIDRAVALWSAVPPSQAVRHRRR